MIDLPVPVDPSPVVIDLPVELRARLTCWRAVLGTVTGASG